MRGLWIERGQVGFRADLPRPEPGPGEVRVCVKVAGICATDLALERGYMGFRGVPGHEFCGVALEGRHAGHRVVGEINAACGRCAVCAAGTGMISLKRLNGTSFFLNPDLMEQMESTPDTVITLTTGNNIVVLESPDEVINKVVEYRRKIQAESKDDPIGFSVITGQQES